MRVLVVGDVHGDAGFVDLVVRRASEEACERVVQLGDLGLAWPDEAGARFMEHLAGAAAACPWDVVPGNHENHDWLEARGALDGPRPVEVLPGLRVLPRGCVITLGSSRCLALGGAISVDRWRREEGRSWWWQESIGPEDLERALAAVAAGPVDVVFSHDAPSGADVPKLRDGRIDRPSAWNRAALQTVLEAARPRWWFHGHHHERYQDSVGGTVVEGLADGTEPDAAMVVVEL